MEDELELENLLRGDWFKQTVQPLLLSIKNVLGKETNEQDTSSYFMKPF